MKQLLLTSAILASLLGLMAGNTPAQAQKMIWHPTSGPQGGAIRDVSVDSAGGLWLATARAGAYYSPDNGESWMAVNMGLVPPKIGLYAISAAKGGYIYGIRIDNEMFYRLNSNLPREQWHWEVVMPDSTQGPYNYAVTLANANVYTNIGGHGIRRSTDNGSTWSVFGDTLATTNIIGLAHGKGIFAAITGNPSAPTQPHPIWITGPNGGSKGENWIKRANFPDFFPSQIAITHNGYLVVSTLHKHQSFTKDTTIHGGRIYFSRDTGLTWTMAYERPDNSEDGKDDIDDLGFVELTNTLYANAHGITVRSIDNGVTWTTLDAEKRGDERFKIASNSDESYFYQICEPDGVFRSGDHGATFEDKFKDLRVEFLNGMDIDSKYRLYTISEYGLSHSYDNGNSWSEPVEFGETYFPTMFISRNAATRDHIFIGCEYGFFRSIDSGQTIQQFLSSGGDTVYRQVGETSSGRLFTYFTNANTSVLQYTTDEGAHWTVINNLPDKTDVISRFAITHDTIVVAGTGPTFYLSENGGNKWTTVTTSAPFNQPGRMLFNHDGSLIAMVPGNLAKSGCWRSQDLGATWTHIFPWVDAPHSQFRLDYFSLNVDDQNTIFLGTDSGIYRSDNKTYTIWSNQSLGLCWGNWDSSLFVNVSDVVQNTQNRRYYAASRGLSVFESVPDLDDVPVVHIAPTGTAIVNYPNPFVSSTSIAFRLDEPSQVILDVYDVVGRHVGQILTATLDAGDHELQFDGRNLPNGNYMVSLRANGQVRTCSMTISR